MGCATALCCCQTVALQLGDVLQASMTVNPVSPIDLKEFGVQIALSLDWHISPRKH